MKPPPQPLRAASYNIRVDHTDDHGTVHDWPYRRALVTSSIVALRADVIGLQEPSPTQAAHLQVDLGRVNRHLRLRLLPASFEVALVELDNLHLLPALVGVTWMSLMML